jgi:hypothetical protein
MYVSTSQHRYFSPEDGDMYFSETLVPTLKSALRQQHGTTTSPSSPPQEPQISPVLTHFQVKHATSFFSFSRTVCSIGAQH